MRIIAGKYTLLHGRHHHCIIIVIINSHELGLDGYVSVSSNSLLKVFQIVFVHLVYNSTLFLAPCCCSFSLHVMANLICMFLVSRQLIMLSTFPKFLPSFVVKKVVPGCSEKFHFD